MATDSVELTDQAMKGTFVKLPDGFKSKVVEHVNPKLIKKKVTNPKLTPSAFMREMSLDTKQKLADTHEMYLPPIVELLDMTDTTLQKYSSLDTDQPLFQPFPSEITFQNYKPCEVYEVPLSLRNHDRVPRMVKVIQEDSPYFGIICPNDVGRKVAPGMVTTFKLVFTPEENKDYIHELVCITEREKFLVPVKAIGARAILDFPDHINFSVCPVKYNSQKTLLVRNIGNREAKFILQTKKPFHVVPIHGNLDAGGNMQVTIEFIPQRIGDHSEDLMVHLDTGEDIFINLYGAAVDVNVRLDKSSLMIEKTYITLANQRVVSICNRSNIIVHFQWKAFATPEEEEQQKMIFFSDLMSEEEEETDYFLQECAGDPELRERISVLSRTFLNRRRMVQDDKMLLSDDTLFIEPLEGDIWPNSTAEISIICRPQQAKIFQWTVYCDVTGRETRLPLRIKAEGMGPKLLLNFDQIDMGHIIINSKHTYEILMTNKGDILAAYSLMPAFTPIGSCFSISPSSGSLLPGGYQALDVTFKSNILGEFLEDLFFYVQGSPKPISVTFKGHVIGPTFNFNVPSLNFGEISFGFPSTISCRLINTSIVPMVFKLWVPGDGTAEVIQANDSHTSEDRRILSWANIGYGVKPKEFTINPNNGTIKAQEEIEIQVTLCSNTLKKYESALVVDVEHVGQEVSAIPISARCVVPIVEVINSQIDLGRCFLKYPYQCLIKLQNTNDLPACYGVVPQELDDQHGVVYSSPKPYGIIDSCSTVEVPLLVEAQSLGEQNTEPSIAIFGKSYFPLQVHLSCIGEGPVVHITSTEIDWGKIQVLSDVPKTICLSNESLIPANVTAKMALEHSKWRLEPSEAVIPPHGHVDLTIMAHLDDTIWSEDKVHLLIENSHSKSIRVQAKGIGSTIVSNKPFGPHLNLGSIFSSQVCRYSVKLTNRGRRHHQIYWKTEGFPLTFKPAPQKQPVSLDMKYKISHPLAGHYVPCFRVRPLRMDLDPGQSAVLVLEGESDTPKVVSGQLVGSAIIGKQSGKERIKTVNILCEFIGPILELSTKQLNFRVEKPQDELLVPQYKPLALKNISPLPLTFNLSMKEPFTIAEKQNEEALVTSKNVKLDVGENLELFIRFDPSYKNDLYTRVAEEVLTIQYLEHPHVDYVSLRGEVNFPNLHFETTAVDFGCILNDTEMVHQVTMINCSPLLVRYHWSFLWGDSVYRDSSSPVYGTGTETEQLNTKEGKDQTKLTDETSIQESTLVIEDDDRNLSNSTMNFNEEEKTDAENETWEGVGSPKASSSVTFNKGQEERSLNLVDSEKLPEDQTEDSKCLSWSCNQEQNNAMLGVEQVFDILPLFGVLQPSESQQMTFTFYGHMNIRSKVKAVCEVEGGPAYEITLKGEASFIKYEFDRKEIDYGHQLFNHVAVTEITLKNMGKVGFDFTVLNEVQTADQEPQPGVPLVTPAMGYIEANADQQLRVAYLPGVPEVFHKSFAIQISHFEPDSITVKGEGTFPRIYLDLPRNIKGNEKYEAFLKEAQETIERETSESNLLSRPETIAGELGAANSLSSYDTLLQMEADRLLIKECSLAQRLIASSRSGVSEECQYAHSCVSRCPLPEFFLDFGFVILGTVKIHIIKITNTGFMPVSFHTDQRALKNTGFSAELHRVNNLPYCETETFEVRFDPRSANLSIGYTKALISIQVVGGPTVNVILQATVTEPDLTVSSEHLDFGTVQCGHCQVITIQLYNHLQVPCEWSFTDTSIVKKKLDKHVPLHLRSKLLRELKPPSYVFLMLPPCGVVNAGERVNVQMTFTPAEEKLYNHQLVLNLAQSSNQVLIMARGQGLEPRLDFSTTLLELGPILPYSADAEGTVVVKNPCSFPVEFYSVEFDEKYLEEEKVLRMMKGYSSLNTLLLPPRQPGERLPVELLDYYKEQTLIQEQEQAKRKLLEVTEGENDAKESEMEEKPSEQTDKPEWQMTFESIRQPSESEISSRLTVASPPEDKREPETEAAEKAAKAKGEKPESTINIGVGELEVTPVSMAIGRYLGLDLSPEACAARNRRGIAFIVHGTPRSGKTKAAIFLANHYHAAYLTIDAVVQEAVSSGSSPVALRAQGLCAKATLEQMLKENEEAAKAVGRSWFWAAQQEGTMQPSVQALGGINVDRVNKQPPEGSPNSDLKLVPASANAQVKTSQVTSRTSQVMQKQHTDNVASQVSTTMQAVQQPVSITTSQIGDSNPISFQLPDDMLVELLAERLQLNDCCQGVVFDGLENQHSNNETSTLLAVLKAINNRRHIYFINLSQEYAVMKAREKAKLQEEEQLAKEEAEKERTYLKELDEDEYEALTEEKRAEFDLKRANLFRERRKKVLNKIHERQLREQKLREEMERLREEEGLKKKSKKGRKEVNVKDDTKKLQTSARMSINISTMKTEAPETKAAIADHNESIQLERGETEEGTKKRRSKDAKMSQALLEKSNLFPEDEVPRSPEKQLFLRFQKYDRHQKKISQILEFWDRSQGTVLLPPSEDGQSAGEEQSTERPVPSSKKGKKERHEKLEKERAEKERAEKDRLEKEKVERERQERLREEKAISSPQSDVVADGEAVESTEKAEKEESIGVPQVRLSVNDPEENIGKIVLDTGKIPSVEEMLDSLGLGPSGPPIPPPALFSVVKYPVERKPVSGQDVLSHFSLSPNVEEGKLLLEDKKEPEQEPELAVPVVKEELTVQHKGKSKKDKVEKAEVDRDKRRSGGHRKGRRDSRSSVILGAPSPQSDIDHSSVIDGTVKEESTTVRAPPYRWILQPGEEVTLQLRFSSVVCGTFDQTLNFELLQTRRCYKLYCRGICTFPTISQDPRVVFRHRIKDVKQQEIPRKKYVMRTGVFQFGPLLCGITRERYKEGQYPENREIIKIVNTSSMEAEVSFCYQHDVKAATYLVDPPSLTLAAHQEKNIMIWAYPTSPGKFDDCLVCCIRENPEPVLFKVSCYGVRAELELDRKQLHFDKMILHRKDTKSLIMRNVCLLPVAWRITGLENLGDDFSLSQDQGVIEPKAEFCVHVHFRATRQINLRKYIRLEVYDAENIIGIVQTENILVLAEAYDVALDISFPKGTDGGIDFGIIKVIDTVKQTITLKNKGKYEIGYKFHLQPTKRDMPDLNSLFNIQPMKGSLSPNDRASHIYIIFSSNISTEIKDEPVLRCQVIEPSLGEGGEVIASIPVKISVRAVFSAYQMLPAREVNFGTVLVGGRRSRTFTLENTGEFDFKYFIFKMPIVVSHQSKKKGSGLPECGDAGAVGYPSAGTQEEWVTRVRGRRGSGLPECGDAGAVGYPSAGTQGQWVTRVRGRRGSGLPECGDAGAVGYPSAGTQEEWATRVRGRRGSGLPECGDAGAVGYPSAGTQGQWATRVRGRRGSGLPECGDAGAVGYPSAGTQGQWATRVRGRRGSGLPECGDAGGVGYPSAGTQGVCVTQVQYEEFFYCEIGLVRDGWLLRHWDLLQCQLSMSSAAIDLSPLPSVAGSKLGKAHDRSSSLRSNGVQKQKEQTPQARLTIGIFTVFPGYGVLSPGSQQAITVECSGDQIGKHEELLSIDVTDRDPNDNPAGIPYWLVIECCAPNIVVDDIRSIFEEHFICQNISLHQCLQTVETCGIYVEDEKRFLFYNVHVGDQAEARFKIINVGKVSADVVVSVKPISNKVAARIVDIFDVEPTRMNVPSYGHKFVTVRFIPQTMQNYQCIFEAVVEAAAGTIPKSKSLLFDIVGDGNLPRINILRPLLRNKIGNPLLIYSRLLLGQTEKLPVVLKNDGTLPAQVSINLSDDNGVFSLKHCIDTICSYPKERYIKEEDPSRVRESCMLTVNLKSGEEATFDVAFKPTLARRLEGALYLTVFNNQYEDTVIHLVGEGYQDDITLDNIHGLLRNGGEEKSTRFLEDKDIEATHLNHIQFGDCHIGQPYQVTFTMTNRSATDVVRFQWLSHINELKISPQFGHLHAACAKDVTVTLKSDLPITYNSRAVKCMVSKITFPVPADQVPDWDNRLSVVKWIDAGAGVRPAKKKVVEVDPEPAHSVLEDSTRELELKISATVDYSDFECLCDSIIFKDTLLYQSRIYSIVVTNKGPGALEYCWKVLMNGRGRGDHIQAVSSDSLTREEYGVASISSMVAHSLTKAIQATSSAVESTSPQVSVDLDNSPFTVEPCNGMIAAMEAQEFQVKFAPLDVGEFEASLICSIPNLKVGSQGQTIAVRGRSLLPYCHFELEDSNYISSHRRNPELSGPWGTHPGAPLDPNTRVVEFQAVGLNTVNKRSFYIMNPTSTDYSFQWIYESAPVVQVEPAFSCLTEKGLISAGKKTEVTFEFVPQQLDITESFWSFKVPQLNISVPFLLCGNTSEPAVSLDRSHINFKFVLLGQKAHETAYMINNEATPFSFRFRDDTVHSEGYGCLLIIEPMEGVVLPHSRTPIVFSCPATAEGDVNFNIVCDIKTKVAPLTLNVKMHVYCMNVVVKCEASDGTVTELNQQSVNEISFGEVELNDHISYFFIIANDGTFNFDFEWELSGPPRPLSCLKLTCKETSVEAGSSASAKIDFHPDHKLVLKDVELKLKIRKGPVYACVLTGYTVTPSVHLSFTTYDFGACFIYNAGMTPCKKTLIITNKQEQPVSLECLFPKNSHLDVKFHPCTLAPKKNVEAAIIFYPREPIKYEEEVTFVVNGLSYQSVEVLGQGTEMKVEVVNPKNKVVYFRALRVGQTVRKVIPIINRSLAPVNFILAMTPNQQLLQNAEVLSLSPNNKITLKAQGGTCNVAVTFSPVCRIPEFAEEVRMEFTGVSKALFVIRGCCQGTEIVLDQDYISFGAVVLRSKTTRLVMMKNVGDIGASFRWEIEKFKPHFSISPVEGYLSPGMEVSLEVAFHPAAVNTDIRVQNLNCFIERATSLQINLTGTCVPATAMKEVVSFSCHVRTKQTHAIQLTNRTNQVWNLWPIIEGKYWTGPKNIIVQPHQQNQPYEVTYKPLTMTVDGKKHQGSVFFPLPDGAGLLYTLQGVAEAPKAVAVINREVPCKTSHTVTFSISNWLHSPQRFRAIRDLIKPERLESTTTLKGLDYIDVPGSSQRDYRLTFFSYKEANISVKMTFRNETTLEYLFYILNIKSTPPGIISTIEMTAPVRQNTSGTVEVENPLTVPTVFSTECKVPDISLPTQLIVPPQTKGVLTFEYQPLREGETSGRLTLNNSELGIFQYDLVLRAGPGGHEKPVYFRTTFGSSQVLGAKFVNLSRQKLEYHCKIDNPEFLVDKSITVHPASPGGSEVSVDVTYEPLQLGESRAILNIVSPIGGKYSIPLFGLCLPAKPQGPYSIRAGSTTSIPFKNIYPQVTTFSFQPDNPVFVCKPTETLRPKKSHAVIVGFEATASTPKSPVIGKLVVSCPQSEGMTTVTSWIYYLKGVTPEK
ncbi:hydrocephalus-inducing protein homolog [Pristis pectinata]|uniref:hydrocephalus-inducing protein homolog n=1 Tax=Pristis pectinata TaxID=685728 RepID=UPI00223C96CE|nr:hydrocephalus-inducing protein homolog [Pristis pectinata]